MIGEMLRSACYGVIMVSVAAVWFVTAAALTLAIFEVVGLESPALFGVSALGLSGALAAGAIYTPVAAEAVSGWAARVCGVGPMEW